jgi:hypothetical protein
MKYVVMILAGGLAYWALEKYAMNGDKFLGLSFETDDAGKPKLSAGYIALGGATVAGAVLVGFALHKATGGKIPAGVAAAH